MADFVVTNAGSPDYNDTYTQGAGLYNDRPWYEGDTNGMFLFYEQETRFHNFQWVLDPAKQTHLDPQDFAYYYTQGVQATPPEGTYAAGTGDEPDAEVAVAGGPGGGGGYYYSLISQRQ